jgi:UDP-N-acetylmuramate--alanine ligase
LRKRFPGRYIRVLFQPHRFARLARYLSGFADELRRADEVIVAPVFAAWSESGSVSSEDLAEMIGDKAVCLDASWAETAAVLTQKLKKPAVIAVLGAGDVNLVIPEILSLCRQN